MKRLFFTHIRWAIEVIKGKPEDSKGNNPRKNEENKRGEDKAVHPDSD